MTLLPVLPGLPLGTSADLRVASTCRLGPGATLLGYTDGLVERRDEDIEIGLARLVDHAGGLGAGLLSGALEALVDSLRDPHRQTTSPPLPSAALKGLRSASRARWTERAQLAAGTGSSRAR